MSSCVYHYCRQKLAETTVNLRHFLVKFIAPKLYSDAHINYYSLNQVPRPMILEVKNYYGNTPLTGVEIGVANGVNALNILKLLNIKTLWLIDPYRDYIDAGAMRNFSHCEYEAHLKLCKYTSKLKWVKTKSENAASLIPNNLDFVYIDGDHSLNCVKKDIELYYAKVKNGIIGGHDFHDLFPSVVKAVTTYAREHKLEYGEDFFTAFPDWWFIKKE